MNLNIRDLNKKTKDILVKEYRDEPIGIDVEVTKTFSTYKTNSHCKWCNQNFKCKEGKIPDHYTRSYLDSSKTLCKGSFSLQKSDKFTITELDSIIIDNGYKNGEKLLNTFTTRNNVIIDFTLSQSNYGITTNCYFERSFYTRGILTENIGLVESQIKYLYNITCFKNNGEIYSSEDYITFDNLNLDIPVNLLNKRLIKN
jgi:hypothetical protein